MFAWLAGLVVAGATGANTRGATNDLIASYAFQTNGTDTLGEAPAFVLTNTVFTGGAVYVNGLYEPNGHFVRYLATAPIRSLRYESFSVSLDFCPQPIRARRTRLYGPENWLDSLTRGFYAKLVGFGGNDRRNILTGGQYYRWLGFNRKDDLLNLTLNNQGFFHQFKKAKVRANRWHRLVCSVDLENKLILTYFDGVKLEPIDLPADFKLEVAGSVEDARDREFGFVNYSNGSVFAGYAANLKIFGRALSDQEMVGLASASFAGRPDFRHSPLLKIALCALVFLVLGLALVLWRLRRRT